MTRLVWRGAKAGIPSLDDLELVIKKHMTGINELRRGGVGNVSTRKTQPGLVRLQ